MGTGVEAIVNFYRISERLGTAGQPTAEQLATVRESGYEVVINLALPTSTNALPDEADIVAGLGMEYVPIPVVWERPTAADLDRFFEAMDRYRDRRVFVHCALNMRVSAFVLLYRVIRQGVPVDTAREAMLRIWQPNETWERFIEEGLRVKCDASRNSAGMI